MLCCTVTVNAADFLFGFDDNERLARVSVGDTPCAFEYDHSRRECRIHVPSIGEVVVAMVADRFSAGGTLDFYVALNGVFHSQGRTQLEPLENGSATQTSTASVSAASGAGFGNVLAGANWMSIAGIGFKLFKTVKVVKVALLAASVGVYSVIFTPQFAMALVAILIFHEYGHIRAMKKFGIPTKGIYLIPFFGGMAIGEKHKSQWQDVYISMMGPVYGLAMSLVFYIIYWFTGNHFCGLVASISALLNLFNLLPVHPLDGGRVIKALVFSGRNYWALLVLLTLSAACAVVSVLFGLYFLVFFIVLGVIDTLSGWRVGLEQDVTPLSRYGIVFSLAWYLAVVAVFIGMILLVAATGLPGSEIATKVLSS